MQRNTKESIVLTSIDDDIANDDDPSSGYTHEGNLFNIAKLKETLKPLILSLRCIGIIYGDVFQAGTHGIGLNSVEPYDNNVKRDVEMQQDHNVQNTTANSVEPYGYKNTQYDVEAQGKNKEVTKSNFFKMFRKDHQHDLKEGSKSNLPLDWSHALGLCFTIIMMGAEMFYWVYVAYTNVVAKDLLDIMKRLLIFSWFTLCTSQSVVCLLTTSYRTKKHPVTRFDKFVKAIVLVRISDVSRLKKCIRKFMIVAWGCIISNAILLLVVFYHPDKEIRSASRAIIFGSDDWTIANTDRVTQSYTVFFVFVLGCWMVPTAFYICLCYVVEMCFDDLFERVSTAILNNTKLHLGVIRREYVQLCHLLTALNDLLSPLGMFIFAIYIPLICLNVNVCIQMFSQDSIINRAGYIVWIISGISILLVTSISGARVNNAACRLSDVLYDIDVNDLDRKSELELMLLLSNITSNGSGVTVGGLVTVTKEMILTVFGTIIGYLTILTQFK